MKSRTNGPARQLKPALAVLALALLAGCGATDSGQDPEQSSQASELDDLAQAITDGKALTGQLFEVTNRLVLGFEQHSETGTDQRLVVDQHHPDHATPSSADSTGIDTRTVKPLPG